MAAMRSRLALGVALAVVFFALGALSTRWLSAPPPPPTAPPTPPDASTGADARDPVIVIDPGVAIDLLPDASLRLVVPPGFDAGAGP